jgi:hypothetical protein
MPKTAPPPVSPLVSDPMQTSPLAAQNLMSPISINPQLDVESGIIPMMGGTMPSRAKSAVPTAGMAPAKTGTPPPAAAKAPPPLAIKDAVPAPPPPQGMVRLYRGGGGVGGSNWVTTSKKYAEGYTTPGLAYHPQIGSYLKYVDVPADHPAVQMPPGQSVHSFEAPPDIMQQLKPFYSPRPEAQ